MSDEILDTVRARTFITSAGATIRRSAKLSYADVAKALDVAPSTVFRWERGERTPGAVHARAYAVLLEEIADAR
jgi:transcriptional regulator with XRE-family HTH domain